MVFSRLIRPHHFQITWVFLSYFEKVLFELAFDLQELLKSFHKLIGYEILLDFVCEFGGEGRGEFEKKRKE